MKRSYHLDIIFCFCFLMGVGDNKHIQFNFNSIPTAYHNIHVVFQIYIKYFCTIIQSNWAVIEIIIE